MWQRLDFHFRNCHKSLATQWSRKRTQSCSSSSHVSRVFFLDLTRILHSSNFCFSATASGSSLHLVWKQRMKTKYKYNGGSKNYNWRSRNVKWPGSQIWGIIIRALIHKSELCEGRGPKMWMGSFRRKTQSQVNVTGDNDVAPCYRRRKSNKRSGSLFGRWLDISLVNEFSSSNERWVVITLSRIGHHRIDPNEVIRNVT